MHGNLVMRNYVLHTDSAVIEKPRQDSGWGDGYERGPGNWEFTTGYFTESGRCVIYERKSGYRSESQSATAMEKSWQRLHKELQL